MEPAYNLKICQTQEDYEQASICIRRYVDWLGIDLVFQDYDSEIRDLPSTYSPPHGCFLIATHKDQLAGGVGFRRFETGICEMKRLWVFPEHRRHKLGSKLCEALYQEARHARYKAMRLDTLRERMAAAVRFYQGMGFEEIPRYYNNPLEGVIFMEKQL